MKRKLIIQLLVVSAVSLAFALPGSASRIEDLMKQGKVTREDIFNSYRRTFAKVPAEQILSQEAQDYLSDLNVIVSTLNISVVPAKVIKKFSKIKNGISVTAFIARGYSKSETKISRELKDIMYGGREYLILVNKDFTSGKVNVPAYYVHSSIIHDVAHLLQNQKNKLEKRNSNMYYKEYLDNEKEMEAYKIQLGYYKYLEKDFDELLIEHFGANWKTVLNKSQIKDFTDSWNQTLAQRARVSDGSSSPIDDSDNKF